MAEVNKVPIKFQFVSEGTDIVVNSFKKLTKAEQETAIAALKLENAFEKSSKTQKKAVDSLNKTSKATGLVNIRMHKLSLALKKQKNDWTSLGISMETGRLALEGNKLAINKVDLALIKLNKTSLLSVRNTRNTHMAFSVLRSKLLLASFAVGLLQRTFLSLVQIYARQEQAELRVANAIKATGFASGMTLKGLKDLTSEMQKNGVVGDEQNLAMASLALTYDKIQGEVFPRFMKAMNDMAVATSLQIPTTEQLKSTTTMLAKALQEPIKGATALRRVGFSLSSQQQQQIKDFMAVGETAKAQNIILEAAERQYGNLAQTIKDSAVGAVAQLDNAWSDAAENMGKSLAVVVLPFIDALKTLSEAMNPERVRAYAAAITTGLVIATIRYVAALKETVKWQLRTGWGAMAVGIGLVAESLISLTNLFVASEDTINDATTSTAAYINSLMKMKKVGLTSELASQKEELEKVKKELEETTKSTVFFHGNIKKLETEIKSLKFHREFAKDVRAVDIEISKLEADINELNVAWGALATGGNLTVLDKDTRDYITTLNNNIATIEDYIKVLDAGFLTQENYNKGLKAALSLYDKTPEKALELANANLTLVNTFINSEKAANLNAESLQNLKDTAKNLGKQIASLNKKAEQNALQKLFGAEAADDIMNGMSNINKAWGMLSSTASMYFANQEAGWAREMQDMKNQESYKRASSRRQEKMEKDLQDKQRGAKQQAWKENQALAQGQVIMDTASAIMNAMTAKPPLAGYALAITAAVMGAKQLDTIRSQKMPAFAKGGDFIADRPQPILVGEAGRERVTITPVDRPESMALGSMGGVTVNFSGNVLSQDFIEDEAIPMIKEAIRRGADIGVA